MSFKNLTIAFFVGSIISITSANAEDLNRVRIQIGSTDGVQTPLQSNLITQGFTVGIDAVRTVCELFEIGISSQRAAVAPNSQVFSLGLTPSVYANSGILHLYAGLFVGWSFEHYSQTAGINQLNFPGYNSSNFALGPQAGIDVAIANGFSVNGSIQYAKFTGASEGDGYLSMLAGVGYSF